MVNRNFISEMSKGRKQVFLGFNMFPPTQRFVHLPCHPSWFHRSWDINPPPWTICCIGYLRQVHVIMEYKSDTRSEQFVESVIYINLTLSWDINLPSPLSNMLNGLFTSKRSSAEKRQGCSKHVRTCLSISNYLAGWWFGTSFIFPYIGNFSIPTEKIIYFRRVAQTSTSHCYNCLQLSRPRSPACRRQLAPWAWWAWCGSSCGRWSASRWSSFSLLGPRNGE